MYISENQQDVNLGIERCTSRASIFQLEIKSEALNDSWAACHGLCHVSSKSINILIVLWSTENCEKVRCLLFSLDICLVSGKSQGWKGEMTGEAELFCREADGLEGGELA